MYTFSPIPPLDTVNDHTGFFLVTIICGLFVLGNLIFSYETWSYKLFTVGLFGCIVGLAAAVSWNTGEIVVYKNTPVRAQFVQYQPEGYNIAETSGKTTRRVDHHLIYVVYRVEGAGNVLLPAKAGQTYPEWVMLYKN